MPDFNKKQTHTPDTTGESGTSFEQELSENGDSSTQEQETPWDNRREAVEKGG